jgi:hypothetical protein
MGYNCGLTIYQNGAVVTNLQTTYTSLSSNNLTITRIDDVYSFYCNGNLVWQLSIPSLDGINLFWGVGDEISSGPSGITAQTAVDNIRCFPLLTFSDSFTSNTTSNYNATYWPYYGASATPNILYDVTNQRAIVQGVGGYGYILMEENIESLIPVGSDFTFSADLTVLREYEGYLYLGDNRPLPPGGGVGTGLRFNIGTYMGNNWWLEIYQNGVAVTNVQATYTPQSPNHLQVTRVNGVCSFYCNSVLVWQQTIPALNGINLYWGLGDQISSGPSGITAQTAIDNINVSSASTNQAGGYGPTQVSLQFQPVVTGRMYTPQFATGLASAVWSPVASCSGLLTNNGNQVSVIDTNPIPPQEFYRIQISLP